MMNELDFQMVLRLRIWFEKQKCDFGITWFVDILFWHGGDLWVGWVEKQVGSSPLGARPSVYARTGYRALLVSIQGIAAWLCPKFGTLKWLWPTRLPTSYCGFRPNDLRDQRGHDLWFSQNEVFVCVCVWVSACVTTTQMKKKMVIGEKWTRCTC